MGINIRKILFIDDDPDHRKILQKRIGKLIPAATVELYDARKHGRPKEDFKWSDYDLLILDYDLGNGENGLDWFHSFKRANKFPVTIMLTAAGNEDLAVRVIKSGIHDYLNKTTVTDLDLERAIYDALEAGGQPNIKDNFVTLQGGIFNKTLFYSKLEEALHQNDSDLTRALLLVRLDNYAEFVEQEGLIVADNIVRHIARVSYEAFSNDELHPNITRFGDHSVALLIDLKDSTQEIEKNLTYLCSHIGKRTYVKDKRLINFSVSVGLVHLNKAPGSANTIFTIANKACEAARKQEGNSFHYFIYGDDEYDPDTQEERLQLGVISALEDNRFYLKFRPMARISDRAEKQEKEFFDISIGMVNLDGTSVAQEELEAAIDRESARGKIDRWILRNCMGKMAEISNLKKQNSVVFVPISLQTLQDGTFFDWLRVLLKDEAHPASKDILVMEVSQHDVLKLKKQVKALVEYLSKIHGFRFLLSNVDSVEGFNECAALINIDFIKFSEELNTKVIAHDSSGQQALATLKTAAGQPVLSILQRIGDAAGLSSAITAGADLAAGEFIGIPVDEIWESSYVEEMEINEIK